MYTQIDDSSFSRFTDMIGTAKNSVNHVTAPRPFQSWVFIRGLGLDAVDLISNYRI